MRCWSEYQHAANNIKTWIWLYPTKITTASLSSSLKLKLQCNMPLKMKGLIRHAQELNPGKKALLS